MDELIAKAANLIAGADGLLITAGAGMCVDSGLPDFRGTSGFWQAYPALGKAEIQFHEIANPKAFGEQPTLAWGFYGHRLNLYRATVPHEGFAILRRWEESKPHGAAVYTSNVDGQFQKAGFAVGKIHECHGSIHWLQCSDGDCGTVWSSNEFKPEVDVEQCRLLSELPLCPGCGKLARPNILMFGDWGWFPSRYDIQEQLLDNWLSHSGNLVVLEIGAGTAIPSVRRFGERLNVPLIRINVRESEGRGTNVVSIPLGGLDALCRIDAAMRQIKSMD